MFVVQCRSTVISAFELVSFNTITTLHIPSAVHTETGHHHFRYIFQPYFMIQIQ